MPRKKTNVIHVTPIGYICDCGTAKHAMSKGGAIRMAKLHAKVNHNECTIHQMKKEESNEQN